MRHVAKNLGIWAGGRLTSTARTSGSDRRTRHERRVSRHSLPPPGLPERRRSQRRRIDQPAATAGQLALAAVLGLGVAIGIQIATHAKGRAGASPVRMLARVGEQSGLAA